jgi:rod shape-determining protein MreC
MVSALKSDLRIFLLLLLTSTVLLIIDELNLLSLPKAIFQTVSVPIQYGLYQSSLTVSNQFEFIILSRRASQENKAIKEQLATVLSENAYLRKKLSETEGFLTQQQSLGPQTFNLAATRPIGISRYLLLDKGSDDGIKINQPVIYKDSFLGKIKEVDPKKSQVMLSSDPDFKTAGFVSSAEGKARGIVLGQFGSEMLIDKVLHKEPLKKGDLVYTEGSELEIPRGLIVGQIAEINVQDNQVFKSAKVVPMFDAAELDVVFVITN